MFSLSSYRIEVNIIEIVPKIEVNKKRDAEYMKLLESEE